MKVFLKNTSPINGGEKRICNAIETIEVGDRVFAKDVNNPDGPLKECVVTAVKHNPPSATYHLTFRFGNDYEMTKRVTPEHPFWVPKRGWIAVENLDPDDVCVGMNGEASTLISKVFDPELVPVYNLEVEGCHTYFVGDSPEHAVLVHNQYDVPNQSSKFQEKTKVDQDWINNLIDIMKQSPTGQKMLETLFSKVEHLYRTGAIKGYYFYWAQRNSGLPVRKKSFLGYDALCTYIGNEKYEIWIERAQTDLQAAALLVHELTHAQGNWNEVESYTNQLNFLKEMANNPLYEKEAKILLKKLLEKFGDVKGNIDKDKFTPDGDYPYNFKPGKETVIDGIKVTYNDVNAGDKVLVTIPKTIRIK